MRYDRLRTFLTALLLSSAVSIGGMGCLYTGFGLILESFPRVLLLCVVFGALGGLLMRRYAGVWLAVFLALVGFRLWRLQVPLQQLYALIYKVSAAYNGAYGWGVLQLSPGASWPYSPADYPVAVYGCLTALAVSRSVVKRKGSWLPLPLGILPLGLCLVVTDVVPEEGWLFLLLFGEAMLLLTGSVRQESSAQANRLVLPALASVLLMLGLIFWLIPREGYVNRAEKSRQWIMEHMESISGSIAEQVDDLIANHPGLTEQTVDLTGLGHPSESRNAFLDVTAQTGGTLYLRVQDYDVYTGKSWVSSGGRRETMVGDGLNFGTVAIHTYSAQKIFFLPSYPLGGIQLDDGRMENPQRETEYTMPRVSTATCALSAEEQSAYLIGPQVAFTEGKRLLESIVSADTSTAKQAEAVAEYVRGVAPYDRGADSMPRDAEDFVLWFLKNADSGYCVHYASAAVVLLRSLGIPARYVTGYMLDAKAGETVPVSPSDAHAWAEYYDGSRWVILEATPSDVLEQRETIPEIADPSDPQATLPESQPETLPEQSEPIHTSPPKTSEPASYQAQKTGGGAVLRKLAAAVVCLALLAVAAAAVWLQRKLRLRLRRRRLRSGTPNQQALACWRELRRMDRLLGETADEDLEQLVEKAVYSHHTLTPGELNALMLGRKVRIRRLRQKPWYRQLVYRYVYALY